MEKINRKLYKLEEAITSLKKGKNKLTISNIAKKAGIARKTIYNNPELKELCQQAIYIQFQKNEQDQLTKDNPKTPSKYKRLEKSNKRLKNSLEEEKEKNAIILEKNRQLVIEKNQFLNKINLLEDKIDRLENKKITQIN